MGRQLGLYIHIPFCKSKCDYCDFYSLPEREARMDAYQKALLAHLKETAPQAKGYLVDTVYFGGGTPSFYGEKRLRELLSAVKKRFEVAGNAEISLEANPDSVDKKSMVRLRRAGVNRVSLGMQSAHDDELEALHRAHTWQQTRQAVAAIRDRLGHMVKLEVETRNLEEVRQALEAGADVIMLDNMDCPTMKAAVDLVAGRALLEASGGITDETLRAVAETGVDIVSIGALTHSVKALDISMKIAK